MHVSGVIFAGGTGARMNAGMPKQFLEVDNVPILIHTLRHFEECDLVDDVVLVCKEEWIDHAMELLARFNITKVRWTVPGGATGQLSIYAGLKTLREKLESVDDVAVLIHDGVRPLIDIDVIEKCVQSISTFGSGVTIAPAIETVITLNRDYAIDKVVERGHCRMAKAPQGFWLKDVLAAQDDAVSRGKNDYIDSASLMSAYGYDIHCIDGPSDNIKITTPIDFYTFQAIYEMNKDGLTN